MLRKTILYIAVSLDGYIADHAGGVSWLNSPEAAAAGDEGYRRFLQTVDTIVMGGRTYRQVVTELSPGSWPYAGLEAYVLTRRYEEPDMPGIHFVNRPVSDLLRELGSRPGKAIWLCGGAELIHACREEDLIDEYHITVMPILLGEGIPLFRPSGRSTPLALVSAGEADGGALCVFRRREEAPRVHP